MKTLLIVATLLLPVPLWAADKGEGKCGCDGPQCPCLPGAKCPRDGQKHQCAPACTCLVANGDVSLALRLALDAQQTDAHHDAKPLTYAEGRAAALKSNKPIVVWIGGKFCPECVHLSDEDFIHVFLTRREAEAEGFRPLADEQVVVGIKDGEQLVQIGTATWWEPGKPAGERHLAHVRQALKNWRERRQVTDQYAPAMGGGWSNGGGMQMQPMMRSSRRGGC